MSGQNQPKGSQRRFYMSRYDQDDWDTAAALAYVMELVDGSDLSVPDAPSTTDENLLTGREAPNREYFQQPMVPANVKRFWASAGNVLVCSAYGLGGSNAQVVETTAAYHRLETVAPEAVLPVPTYEELTQGAGNAAASDRQFIGNMATLWGFSAARGGHPEIRLGLIGSGNLATPDEPAESGLTLFDDYPTSSQITVTIQAASVLGSTPAAYDYTSPTTANTPANSLSTNISDEVVDLDIELQMAIDEESMQGQFGTGVNTYSQCPKRGNRSGTATLNVELDASNDFWRLARYAGASVQYAISVECVTDIQIGDTSVIEGYRVLVPLARLVNPPQPTGRGIQQFPLNFEIMQDNRSGTGYPLGLVVVDTMTTELLNVGVAAP